mgnify:CR=1 FL=1
MLLGKKFCIFAVHHWYIAKILYLSKDQIPQKTENLRMTQWHADKRHTQIYTCIDTYTTHVYILIQHMYTYLYSTCIRTYTTHVYIDIQHMYTQIICIRKYSNVYTAVLHYTQIYMCKPRHTQSHSGIHRYIHLHTGTNIGRYTHIGILTRYSIWMILWYRSP